jgi:HTH-type transcriptional regulator/antitoxin HigA
LLPIRSPAAYRRGLAVANGLLRKKAVAGRLTRATTGYLVVLIGLIETYERQRFPRKRVGDGEILDHLLESRDVTQVQVEAATGIAAPTLSAVIAGRRRLTRDQIGRIAKYFRVVPTVFSFDEVDFPSARGIE